MYQNARKLRPRARNFANARREREVRSTSHKFFCIGETKPTPAPPPPHTKRFQRMITINSTCHNCKRFAITVFLFVPCMLMIVPSLFSCAISLRSPGRSSSSKSGFRSNDRSDKVPSKQSPVASFLMGPMPRKGQDFKRITKRRTSPRPISPADGVQHSKSKKITTKNYHLTILIPAYNERYRIGDTLSTYVNYLSRTPVYQHHPSLGGYDAISRCSRPVSSGAVSILVVDDGSSDGTADFIGGKSWWNSSFAEHTKDYNCWNVDENVSLISLSQNSGKGAAIERGMAELLPSSFPGSSNEDSKSVEFVRSIVLVADADGSGDISCIDSMLYCMEEMLSTSETARLAKTADQYPFDQPPAVVVGSRQYLGRKSPLRALLSWGFRTCVSIIFIGSDLGIRDTQCGFKLMTNSAGKVLYNKLNLRRWTQDVEVIHRARVIGIPVGQCDVPWVDKEGSKLVSNTSDVIIVSLNMLSEIANMRLRYALGVWKVPLHNADYE